MTHKVQELGKGEGEREGEVGAIRDTLSRRHLPWESSCSRDTLFPMPNISLHECVPYGHTGRGGFFFPQTPSLSRSCPPLYRCPFRKTSFSAQPSLFQRVSLLLLPLTFPIPPFPLTFFFSLSSLPFLL